MVKSQAQEIRAYLIKKIPVHPKNIVAKAAKAFACSRTTIHRHLNRLLRDGEIIKTGTTRQIIYFLKTEKNKKILVPIESELEENNVWKESFAQDFEFLPKNVRDICEYGFLKILNNAINHSEGTGIIIQTKWSPESISIAIQDDGIGIFRKIQNTLGFKDVREIALHLSKGMFRTDSGNHLGESIFFVSRSFDDFHIISRGTSYIRKNLDEDWFVETTKYKSLPGTSLIMKIALNSTRTIQEVYAGYQHENSERILKFDKTNILVVLSKLEEERYVSRSQARRICFGLEKFKCISLDFKNISTIGYGFVDEIFRVFQLKYPTIKITYININEDVRFMIENALSGDKLQ